MKGKETFATVKEAYGEDREYPHRKPKPAEVPPMTHDIPFKPSHPPKRGYNKTLAKFPEYKEDPMRVVVRKKETEGSDEKKWKPTHNKKSIPSSSVSTNYRNLKSDFPTVFRRL